MDIQKFITERPFLYHLTSKENVAQIVEAKKLYSTNELIKMSKDKSFLPVQRQKRPQHVKLIINGIAYYLRDQRPISEKALSKCLTDNWNVGDFLYHLNDRVFMWPTIERLERHFKRYKQEKPVILRFSTREVIEANPHVKFCRLNSGATRPNSHLGGIAPLRGPNTFVTADQFLLPIRDVAEVTFEKKCDVDIDFSFGPSPEGKYRSL